MNVLISGSSGFIASYLIEQLLVEGHYVIGLDINPLPKRSFSTNPNYEHCQCDLRDQEEWRTIDLNNIDYVFLLGAKLGGIGYFHEFPFEMISDNEKILCNSFDMLDFIKPKTFTYVSSSMVYESATHYPVKESDLVSIPAPKSHYGFQKLTGEFWSSGFTKKTGIPHTIIRPFNAVGANESLERISDISKTHVLPEFCYRALTLKYDEPFPILGDGQQIRSFTHGRDIARAMVLTMENPASWNETFNVSSPLTYSMAELAQLVWGKVHNWPCNLVHLPSYEHDVQKRIPNVEKAKRVLGFEAEIGLEETIDEVLEHVRNHILREIVK